MVVRYCLSKSAGVMKNVYAHVVKELLLFIHPQTMYVTPWSTGSDHHGDYEMECCNATGLYDSHPLGGYYSAGQCTGKPKESRG